MKQYRKKPVVIEAVQFNGSNLDQLINFSNGLIESQITERRINGENYVIIPTLEGEMKANEGDYIIKGVQGEFYPCKPDVFEKTYEEVK